MPLVYDEDNGDMNGIARSVHRDLSVLRFNERVVVSNYYSHAKVEAETVDTATEAYWYIKDEGATGSHPSEQVRLKWLGDDIGGSTKFSVDVERVKATPDSIGGKLKEKREGSTAVSRANDLTDTQQRVIDYTRENPHRKVKHAEDDLGVSNAYIRKTLREYHGKV